MHKPTLYEVNAEAAWGDSCEADFWGIIDFYGYEEYCKNCPKRTAKGFKRCSHWQK